MCSKPTRAWTPPSMLHPGRPKTTSLYPTPHHRTLVEAQDLSRLNELRWVPHGKTAWLCQYKFARLPFNKAVMSPKACPWLSGLFPSFFSSAVGSPALCPHDVPFHLPKLASRESPRLLHCINLDQDILWALSHTRSYNLREVTLKGQTGSLPNERGLKMTFLVSQILQSRQPLPWLWRWACA